MSWPFSYRAPGIFRAFTLIELLVVMGLISLLGSILLPALHMVESSSRATRCMSNVRQIEMELFTYASMNNGRFPPNLTSPTGFQWTDADKIGRLTPTQPSLLGPVATCPEDPDALRSYAMNVWASSAIDAATRAVNTDQPWRMGANFSTRLILVTEKWSSSGSMGSWVTPTPPIIGATQGTPAQRFGAGSSWTGLNPLFPAGRFKGVSTELPFMRHRVGFASLGTQAIGRVTIGYLDGHVELVSNDQLINKSTGLSTLQSIWSPADHN